MADDHVVGAAKPERVAAEADAVARRGLPGDREMGPLDQEVRREDDRAGNPENHSAMSRTHRLAERARTGVVEISDGNHVTPATAHGETPEALGAREGERLGEGEGRRRKKQYDPREHGKFHPGRGEQGCIHRASGVASALTTKGHVSSR